MGSFRRNVAALVPPKTQQSSVFAQFFMKNSRIFVAGHAGMVGQALVRSIKQRPGYEIQTAGRSEVDLCRQSEVENWMNHHQPDVVVVAAAKVGGIHANATYPAEFMYNNLMIAANVIHSAFSQGVKRLLFLGSSCIYPREAVQPMTEDCLLSSALEPTNEAYALAKIAGLKLCQHYRRQYGVLFHSAMPTNLYGPGDNYHSENSHVIPGLIRRFHQAKNEGLPAVTIWGTGRPLREFLHADDLAEACLHLLNVAEPPDWVNVGSGEELCISDLAQMIGEVVGYTGEIRFDATKPDGTPRKRLDCSLISALGWRPRMRLLEGLKIAYADFLSGGGRLGS
jgi:GDP-L-fucose synthase